MKRLPWHLLVMALWLGGCEAAEVLVLEVDRHGPVYEVVLDAQVAIPAATVQALITDYAHLDAINPSLREIEVLSCRPPVRVRMVSEVCFWLFCNQVAHVQDFRPLPDGLRAVIVPETSDFRGGQVSWHLHDEGPRTRIQMHAWLEPAFPVLPLVGPLLIRAALRRMAEQAVTALERRGRGEPRSGTSRSRENRARCPERQSLDAAGDHR